jgi:hypothetical protein
MNMWWNPVTGDQYCRRYVHHHSLAYFCIQSERDYIGKGFHNPKFNLHHISRATHNLEESFIYTLVVIYNNTVHDYYYQ